MAGRALVHCVEETYSIGLIPLEEKSFAVIDVYIVIAKDVVVLECQSLIVNKSRGKY